MSESTPIELAGEIVAALFADNPVLKGELPALVHAVHMAIARLAAGSESAQPQIELQQPAVPIRGLIIPEFLIFLWKLPPDYLMVAPNYAA